MRSASPSLSSRRGFVAGALGLLLPEALAPGATAAPARRKVVTILGDSITAGYGLRASAALSP